MKNEIVYQDNKYQIKIDKKYKYYHLFPLPSEKELKEYYKKEFYGNNYKQQINDSSKQVQKEELEFFNMQYEDILETIKKEAPGKKIIDIGCGYGNFLKFCQNQKFKVIGLDPVQDAVDYVKRRGINAFRAKIENFKDVIPEKYHVVVMLNVLEHLRKPYKVLTDIRNYILEDRGLLVVRVPNEFNKLQLIASQAYGLNKWWVCIPQHINYFTVDHLEKLIVNCGYEILLKESTFPLEIFILLGEQYVGNPHLGKTIHKKRVLFEKTLKKYNNEYKRKIFQTLAEKELGREITIYARKK